MEFSMGAAMDGTINTDIEIGSPDSVSTSIVATPVSDVSWMMIQMMLLLCQFALLERSELTGYLDRQI